MIKVKKIINNNLWKCRVDDEIVLDYQDRNRRRIKLDSKKKLSFLLDEKETVFLNNGSLLILSNEYKVKVIAKLENVLKVEAKDKRNLSSLAWHIGNRHIPAEIHKDYIIIQRDEIISRMLKLLGAKVVKKKLSFTPEKGAYHK
ncbi:urease accessory protein UreE [Alphaproteobacteria bacterium]|nr:urease accessory protein UreE [Alphaproteobacteria bacterium]